METTIRADGVALPATVDLPAGPVRGGLIALHSASDGDRSFFCYEHLGQALREHGIAVLRFDRRPRDGGDVPLRVQAADTAAAIGVLRQHVGDRPVGIWGFSQGAWAAALTAATHPEQVACLVLVSGAGVSPAAQMRYGCAEQLRRRGYGATDLAELARLRASYEAYQRGELDQWDAQAVVDDCVARPWFDLVKVPRRIPDRPGGWPDVDYDPVPTFAAVSCPVLAFYGDRDEWVPVADSIAAWERATAGRIDLSVHRLAGCDHHPTLDDRRDLAGISPDYTRTLVQWLRNRLDITAA